MACWVSYISVEKILLGYDYSMCVTKNSRRIVLFACVCCVVYDIGNVVMSWCLNYKRISKVSVAFCLLSYCVGVLHVGCELIIFTVVVVIG